MSRTFMGVDIGTYSAKGVVLDESGALLAHVEKAHELSVPAPGQAEHDAEKTWWGGFVAVCRELLAQDGVDSGRVAAVGCSAIAPAVVPLDVHGYALRPAILYGIDVRAEEEIRFLNATLGEERIRARTGASLSSQSAGPKILWLARHEPDVVEKTATFASATTFLVQRLTGRLALDRYTATAFAPLFNVHDLAWDAELAEPVCSPDRLPELFWTTDVVGHVTPWASQATGLPKGVPVIAGTADAAAEAVSAGASRVGDLMVMYGSSGFFILLTGQLGASTTLWPAVWLQPGQSVLTAGSSTSGALLKWFLAELDAPTEGASEEAALGALNALAAGVPAGSEGLVVLPYFSGERTPIRDARARGVIAGLSLRHGRAHLYRAFLEATAYAIRDNVEAMRAEGEPIERVLSVGGGTRNRLWLQIVSDVTGLEQHVPAQEGGAALGDAFLAALGVGAVAELSAIARWLGSYERVRPDMEIHSAYEAYFRVYRDLYRSSAREVHELAALAGRPGWKLGG
ncbi:MAG: FGGY family carbohydrate kinase [Deinococcales bacterium]